MSQKLISLNPDLKRLRDEGYEIEVKGAYLLTNHIPFVNSKKEVIFGTLATKLELAGDKTTRPVRDHVISFIGEAPCDSEGSLIRGIYLDAQVIEIAPGLNARHRFSSKPPRGYFEDYYEKITSYANILSSHAEAIDPSVSAKTFNVIESNDPEYVFNYLDTNSSRAEIDAIAQKLQELKIGIIGLGGTGSYILDFLAKTSVKEIHLFDGDDLMSHNAFRAPGAASLEQLRLMPKKVRYFYDIYSKIHKNIIPHPEKITSSNIEELYGKDFVFICIDKGESKKAIIEKLLAWKISFIDVGMGINLVDGSLAGCVRTTSCTELKTDHLINRISLSDESNNEYSQNIQIAELNALNAALAIIKWKKQYGYYHDMRKECDSSYLVESNELINEDFIT